MTSQVSTSTPPQGPLPISRKWVKQQLAIIRSELEAALDVAVVATTRAELNAGKVIVPAVTGKKVLVTNFTAKVVGAFDTSAGTSANLQDGAGTPVIVAVGAKAALTDGALIGPFTANVTPGAGFGVALTVSEELNAKWIGTAADAGTSITWTVTYALVD